MITEILKKDNKDIYEMINKNNQAKSKLKQIETYWKQIEQIIKLLSKFNFCSLIIF